MVNDSIWDKMAPAQGRGRGKAGDSRWEVGMNVQRRLLLLATSLATSAAVAGPAAGQPASPAAGQADTVKQGAASIPDFSGIWHHGSLPWLVPPASGPGP